MSVTALKKRFVPLGQWSPDAPEFAPGFLDQIVNVIPVFGVYRTLQKTRQHSLCPELRRVTGTYVHRISEDLTVEPLQPVFSEAAVKDGFQSVPFFVGGELQPYWKMLRGLAADASSTVLLVPRTIERTLYGNFAAPVKDWDAVSDLKARYQYRIYTGFEGLYDFTIEFGIVTGDPELEAGFTVLGSFSRNGDLAVALDTTDGESITGEILIANALVADPAEQHRYAWRIKQTIDENAIVLDPDRATSAATTGEPSSIANYTTQAGSNLDTNIVAAITGLVAGAWPAHVPGTERPGDPTFAISSQLWSTSTQGRGFYFKMPLPQFKSLTGHYLKMRYSMDSIAQFVGLGMFQGLDRAANPSALKQWGTRNGPTIGATVGYADAAFLAIPGNHLSDTVMEIQLDLNDINDEILGRVSDWNDIWFLFFTWPPVQGVGTSTTIIRSSSSTTFETNAGPGLPWTGFGIGTMSGLISDNNDGSGVFSPLTAAGSGDEWFRLRIGGFFGPRESVTKIIAKIRAFTSGGGTTLMKIEIQWPTDFSGGNFQGISNIQPIQVVGPGIAEYSFDANISGINALSIQNLFLKVYALNGSTGQFQVADVWLEIQTGISSRARLHAVSYFGPEIGDDDAPAPIDVSWLRLDGPTVVSDIQGDSVRGYLGTVEVPTTAAQEGKIYEVSSPLFSTWVDVSRTAGYTSNKRDKSWSFTNFGSMVIATNFAEPVQVKYEGDPTFQDLIGFSAAGVAIPDYADPILVGGVYPRARYAATINAFLCLANCDPQSVLGTAAPYSFWCSKYAEPQYFSIGDTTWQSSVFQLVSTPGEITGLVGGEYGLVFKENSIWRADYVGLPQIFNFTQLSGEQGTTHPRSIVKVDSDVYFWGIGGIYVIREGRQLEEIAAQGSVRKFLFDPTFEDFSISNHAGRHESEASAKVVGGYDTYTGCIFWAYQTRQAAEDWFECDAVILYSPRENRFTLLRGDMDEPEFPSDRMVTAKDIFPNNKLRISGFLSLGNRQTEGEIHLLKTIFAVRDIPPEVASFSENRVYEQLYRSNTISSSFFGAPIGVEIEIQKIRPILAIEDIEDPLTGKKVVTPRFAIWIEANQSPVIGDTNGELRYLDTGHDDLKLRAVVSHEGWIDLGQPISGEFFKFAQGFAEYGDPIVKEVHGWQVLYRIAGDR